MSILSMVKKVFKKGDENIVEGEAREIDESRLLNRGYTKPIRLGPYKEEKESEPIIIEPPRRDLVTLRGTSAQLETRTQHRREEGQEAGRSRQEPDWREYEPRMLGGERQEEEEEGAYHYAGPWSPIGSEKESSGFSRVWSKFTEKRPEEPEETEQEREEAFVSKFNRLREKAAIEEAKSRISASRRRRFIATRDTAREVSKAAGKIASLGGAPKFTNKELYVAGGLSRTHRPIKSMRELNLVPSDSPAKMALQPQLGSIVALQPQIKGMQRLTSPSSASRVQIAQKARSLGKIKSISSPLRSKVLSTQLVSGTVPRPVNSLVGGVSKQQGSSRIGAVAKQLGAGPSKVSVAARHTGISRIGQVARRSLVRR